MAYSKGISRIFVRSLAPVVQRNLEATVEIDPFHERASVPPKISKCSCPNDESWGGVIWGGVDGEPFLLASLHARWEDPSFLSHSGQHEAAPKHPL